MTSRLRDLKRPSGDVMTGPTREKIWSALFLMDMGSGNITHTHTHTHGADFI
jgi:hypothetical protein